MALRLRQQRLITVSCHPTVPRADTSGGFGVVEQSSPSWFTFKAVLLPPQRRVTRGVAGVRLATVWAVIPEGFPAVHERDNLYFPDDARAYTVTALKRYPRHMALNVELLQ